MNRILDRYLLPFILVAGTVVPAQAMAGAAEKAAAESLYRAALGLMEKADYRAACPKLIESQQIDPAVGTLLYLGECYEKLGLTASAWVTFASAGDAAKRANQLDRAQIANVRAAQLAEKVSYLTLTVAPEAQVPGLEVKRDNVVVGSATWGARIPIDPGEHTLEATAPGRKPWSKRVKVEAGTRVDLVEPLPVLAEATRAVDQKPLIANQSEPITDSLGRDNNKPGQTQRLIAYGLGGAGVVGIAIGTVFGFRAKSKETDSEAYCAPDDKTSCTHHGVQLINEGKTAATVANIGFVGGALAIAGGAVLYLTAPKATATTASHRGPSLRLVPDLLPTQSGVSMQGDF